MRQITHELLTSLLTEHSLQALRRGFMCRFPETFVKSGGMVIHIGASDVETIWIRFGDDVETICPIWKVRSRQSPEELFRSTPEEGSEPAAGRREGSAGRG